MAVHDWSFEKINALLEVSKKPVVVELYMPDCRPCKLLEVTLSDLSEEFEDEVIFCKCRFDEYKGDRSMDTVPQLSIHTPVKDNETNRIVYGRIALTFQSVVAKDKLRSILEEELDKLEDLFSDEN